MNSIADMLAQIMNAQRAGHPEVAVQFSAMKHAIVTVLQREGYVAEVEKIKRKMKKSVVPYLRIALMYRDGEGAIHDTKLISKSSRRVYAGADKFPKVKSGFGIALVSTPQGIMTARDAHGARVGGEVLFEIW